MLKQAGVLFCGLLVVALLHQDLLSGRTAYEVVWHHPSDWDKFTFVAVETEHDDVASIVAHHSEVEVVGRIGHLDRHFLLRIPLRHETTIHSNENINDIRHLDWESKLGALPNIRFAKRQLPKKLTRKRLPRAFLKRAPITPQLPFAAFNMTDPDLPKQWHLYNQLQPGADTNVTGAWSLGVFGEGVVVAVIDDGVQADHEDLSSNFFLEGSYDFNAKTQMPLPRLAEDYHGTRCAGAIAAVPNNYCGVGVAPKAKISGGQLTDVDEANAVNYAMDKNHIFSCSWGPEDDGGHVEGPNELVTNAFKTGIEKGRNGLGTIFVFATGNGGYFGDNCNYDGYTNSIWSISIGALDRDMNHPLYSEMCSAHLGVTSSSSSDGRLPSIFTTDKFPANCTDHFGGTSAAAPIAAGILALALSARPELTWRDMQHVALRSMVPFRLEDQSWQTNGVNRKYSHAFGYGRLDAYRAVMVAKNWTLVGPHVFYQSPVIQLDQNIPHGNEELKSTFTVTREMLTNATLGNLEHVTVTVNITHYRRGYVDLKLTSPSGSMSLIGPSRRYDSSKDGFKNWTFSSVVHWDENPVGNWTLIVKDTNGDAKFGKLHYWWLTLYGEKGNATNHTTIHTSTVLPTETPIPNRPTKTSSGSIWLIVLVFGCLAGLGFFGFKFLKSRHIRRNLSLRRRNLFAQPMYATVGEQQYPSNEENEIHRVFGMSDSEWEADDEHV